MRKFKSLLESLHQAGYAGIDCLWKGYALVLGDIPPADAPGPVATRTTRKGWALGRDLLD
jgi:hypothetical protein